MTPIRDRHDRDDPNGQPPLEGTLAELVELEEQIESDVARATAEAEQILARARSSVARTEDEHGTSLDQAIAALRTAIEQQCSTAIEAIEASADADAEPYRQVDEATLSRLISWVAARVSRGAESS